MVSNNSRQLAYHKNRLNWNGIPLLDIINKYGSPAYVYNADIAIENVERIKKAAGKTDLLICYALKANNNFYLLKQFAELGAGADVVSGGELKLATEAGIPPEKIVYAGVGKTEEEIEYALKRGIYLFNVESSDELNAIDAVAGRLNRTASVAFRVNPDIDAESHPYITTGMNENKFGIAISGISTVITHALTLNNIAVKGLHVHIGSQIRKLSPFTDTARAVKRLVENLRKDGINLSVVDFGGGLGHDYYTDVNRLLQGRVDVKNDEGCITIEDWIGAFLSEFGDGSLRPVIEPGRSIIAGAGILLVKVLYMKKHGAKRFLICNTGMNDLIRPALYQAYHGILPCILREGDAVKTDVVGPICETSDFFARNMQLPQVQQGDILAVLSAGAYGYTLASNYNMHLKPPEIVLHNDAVILSRRREDYSDLTKTTMAIPVISRVTEQS